MCDCIRSLYCRSPGHQLQYVIQMKLNFRCHFPPPSANILLVTETNNNTGLQACGINCSRKVLHSWLEPFNVQ
jgi:hypothetical protein